MNDELTKHPDHEPMPEGEEAPPPLTHMMAIIRWCLLGGMALFAVIMVLGFFGLPPFAQPEQGSGAQYHCPMHPTYVSNQPGECPICGMSLVSIGGDKSDKKSEVKKSSEMKSSAKPGQYTCPMHPEIVSDTAGRCPKCNMFLEQVPADSKSNAVAKVGQYTCPMHPEIISDTMGECPICGMDLELVTADSQGISSDHEMNEVDTSTVPGLVPVTIEPKRLRLIGLQTALAERMSIGSEKRLTGYVTVDETKLVHIHLRSGGWVTKAMVVENGSSVTVGQPLLIMYSQDLFAASQEYVLARKALARTSSDTAAMRIKRELVEAARYRLLFFGASPADIAAIDSSNIPMAELIVRSPVNGYVFEKSVNDGQYVNPDATLYSLADHNAVWLIAEVYEQDMDGIRVGQVATVTTESFPGEALSAEVVYIYPAVSEKSRTGKIRLEITSSGKKLKPGMYATVNLQEPGTSGVTVPEDAILDGGETQYLFVVHDSTHFVPRVVKVGRREGNRVEILSGLTGDETVVTNANFLIDSESRLKAALSGMSATPRAEHKH
jgi:RND family efflux transporter MFP subunit